MSAIERSFRAALRRRVYLLAAALYACNALLVTFAAGNMKLVFQLKAMPFLNAVLHAALWSLPAHLGSLAMIYGFFLETVCKSNPAFRTNHLTFLIVAPLTVGPLWGYCTHQVLTAANPPYAVQGALQLAVLAGGLAVAVISARRWAEQRHNYIVEASPSMARKLGQKLCHILPVAIRDTLCSVLFIYLLQLAAGVLAAAADASLETLTSFQLDAPSARGAMSLLLLLLQSLLFFSLLFLGVCKALFIQLNSFCSIVSTAAAYHCALVFLVVYLALSLAEESMRLVIFHPMRFYRLNSFFAASVLHPDKSILGAALATVLPSDIASADRWSDNAMMGGKNTTIRRNVRVSSETVSRTSGRPHQWLEALIAQLDVADSILKTVAPSSACACPLVPALIAPTATKPGTLNVSISSGCDNAVLVLMQALAAHDFSRSARLLHSLDRLTDGGHPECSSLSQHHRNLLESELSALPLIARDWCLVSVASCAVIDAAALQFTLAAAFIEDEMSRNNMILAEPGRMSERQLASSICQICLSYIPLPAHISKALSALKGLIIRKQGKVSAAVQKSDISPNTGSEVHLKPVVVGAPVIVSEEARCTDSGRGDSSLDTRLKVSSFIATQLISDGRSSRANSFFAKIKHACYCYMLRNEINKPGILDLLLSAAIGQSRARSFLEAIKTRKIPVCPVPAAVVQTCVHTMEALTILMGLDLRDKSSSISSHVAATITSLLGLELALKNHKIAYQKYVSRNIGVHNGSRILDGGKELFSLNEGGVAVAQTPWVSAEIQALSMGLDDAFARMFSKYGDVIPSYSYPASYLDQLKERLYAREF